MVKKRPRAPARIQLPATAIARWVLPFCLGAQFTWPCTAFWRLRRNDGFRGSTVHWHQINQFLILKISVYGCEPPSELFSRTPPGRGSALHRAKIDGVSGVRGLKLETHQKRRSFQVRGVFSFTISRSIWYLKSRVPRLRIASIILAMPVSRSTEVLY